MKVKFIRQGSNEIFVHNDKVVNVGGIVDLPNERAKHYISLGVAEKVVPPKQVRKSTKKNSSK